MAMTAEKYVGASVPRKEDAELITGTGRYTDDLTLPGALAMVVVREAAMADGPPIVHEEFGTNVAYHTESVNGDVDGVFASSPVVVKERYYLPRMIPNAIEPRGCIGQSNPATGELTLWSSTQI